MKAAIEHHFSGQTIGFTGGVPAVGVTAGYDATKTMISHLNKQYTGPTLKDRYISPKSSAMINNVEIFGLGGSQFMPHIYQWSDNIYWIFTASNAVAAVTRNFVLTEFNSDTSTLTFKGYVTLSGTTIPGSKFVRSFRAMVYKHTTGTVSTSGSSTTISGSGTEFADERIAVGARIGFGTTDPTQVTTWYEITAIANNTSLTINTAVNLAASTPYVIEEIRLAAAIAVTAAAGVGGASRTVESGIYYIKGLNYSTFAQGGTVIPEATTVDNIRASYLLTDPRINSAPVQTFTVTIATPGVFTCTGHGLRNGDVVILTTTGALPTGLAASSAATITQYFVINSSTDTFNLSATLNGVAINTSGSQSGTHTIHSHAKNVTSTLALDEEVSKTDHRIYLVSTYGTSCSITEYNLRAALTVGAMGGFITAGTSQSAYTLSTLTQAVLGTPSLVNGGRIFTLNHGSASGIKSLYFTTTTRIYRVPDSNITDASSNWLEDSMIENPPGSSTTYTLTNSMQQVEYSPSLDRLIIATGVARFGTYITTYSTAGDQFEKYIGASLNRTKLTTTPSGATDALFPQAAITMWAENGWMVAIPNVVTTGQNFMYVFPLGTDAFYESSTNQSVITPKLPTTNASRLYQVYVHNQDYSGTYALGFPTDSYRLWYRTSGIDDNSGTWTEIEAGEDLSASSVSDYIQFKIAFEILGEITVPTRVYSLVCVYEDTNQDSRYQPSLSKSSTASKIFAWKQVSSWNSDIPNMRIRLYDANNNILLIDDNVTDSSYGTWEYSTDGTNWTAWDASADAIGNFIRYTATTFGYSGVTVRALLTQA